VIIGGLQKFSLADFPGKASAIVFTRGCNFRCPYCHNPELVDPNRFVAAIPEEEVIAFLRARVSRLRGVVITGGEPTIYPDLPEILKRIKALGFQVKLDTNGSNPELLERIISECLVDAVSMDVKAPLPSYLRIVRAPVSTEEIRRSIRFIIKSGIQHEMRTTYLDSLLSTDDMREIGELVRGCMRFSIQPFRPTKVLAPCLLEEKPPAMDKLRGIKTLLEGMGIQCELG
jgi:pyruvate formate lyase activating enzyme